MVISSKNLHGIEVQSKSGQELGVVVAMLINTDTQEIEQYEVRTSLVKQFLGKSLLIHRKQVISIEEKRLVVEDGIIEENNLQPAVE